jgi:hypothetical protein
MCVDNLFGTNSTFNSALGDTLIIRNSLCRIKSWILEYLHDIQQGLSFMIKIYFGSIPVQEIEWTGIF